ncbi:MAG: sialidase family protein, partial [Vicingaceae bacterium]
TWKKTTGYLKNSQQGSAGILKSTDFGNTWTTLNTGIPATGSVLRIEVAVAPTNSNHIYALACNIDKGLYGVYSSLDGGANWNFSNAGGVNILEWFDGAGTGGQGTYDLCLLIDPLDENKIYTGGVNIWGSTDGGSTFNGASLWYDFAGPGTGLHADQHQLKHNPLDNKFYLCNDGGLVRTSDIQLGSWSDANNVPGYTWPTVWEYISDGMQ